MTDRPKYGGGARHLPVMITTQSEQQAFRSCRKAWKFGYEEGLRAKRTKGPITFGTASHAGLESAYLTLGTVPEDQVIDAAQAAARASIDQAFREWIAKTEEVVPDLDVTEFYADAKELVDAARWVVGFFLSEYAHDFRRMVPIAVERPFQVPLVDSRGNRLNHLQLAGVWDLVFYDPNTGDIVIDDHKSTGSDTSDLDLRAELDPQMEAYLYALRWTLRHDPQSFMAAISRQTHNPHAAEAARVIGTGHGLITGRVRYNVLRRKMPSEPKINKDGTVSVAAIDTLPEYYARALEIQAASGKPVNEKQAELLQRLQGKGAGSYVSRREFWRSNEDVERWRETLILQSAEMRAAQRDPALAYRNPGNCIHPWSMKCDYRPICVDDAPELRAQYEIRPRHQEVLAAAERNAGEEGNG